MEKNEISIHQIRILDFVSSSPGWVTAKEIAAGAKVSDRTARQHASALVRLGVFDQAEVFPAHRYCLAKKADKRNKGYMIRINNAREAFGLPNN